MLLMAARITDPWAFALIRATWHARGNLDSSVKHSLAVYGLVALSVILLGVIPALGIGVTASALMFLRTTDPGPLEELRLRAFDIFQVIKPRDATSRPVVIVDIDEVSLQKLGQFPWPRTRIADMITRLTRLGAAAIAFDVVFSEPDRLSPALAADVYRDLDDETRNKLRALPSNDQIMADAMRPSRVVLGQTGLPTVQPEPDVQLPFAGVAALGGDPKRFVYEFPGLLRNIPILENAAAGRGVFSIRTERDGIVRRVPMVVQAQGNVLPSLSFETLRVATGSSTILSGWTRQASRALPCPVSKCRPIATGSFGFILHRTTRRVSYQRSICSRAASRPTACHAGLF